MAISNISFPKPNSHSPAGFAADGCSVVDEIGRKVAERRRRRELLEHYFSPVVSEAAMPSAVDRLVLWRSRHGCRRA